MSSYGTIIIFKICIFKKVTLCHIFFMPEGQWQNLNRSIVTSRCTPCKLYTPSIPISYPPGSPGLQSPSPQTSKERLHTVKVAKDYMYIPDLQTAIMQASVGADQGSPLNTMQRPDDPGNKGAQWDTLLGLHFHSHTRPNSTVVLRLVAFLPLPILTNTLILVYLSYVYKNNSIFELKKVEMII